jgi:hypothetical protein
MRRCVMKKYSSENPVFSEAVDILETTDTNNAGNFNVGTKELYENTLVNHKRIQKVEEEANTMKDDSTGDKYQWGIDNGAVYLEKVEATSSEEGE